MALSTRAVQAKIKSVNNIKKITKAMEMVAASKMRKAVSRALQTREYTEAALSLLVTISRDAAIRHPYFQRKTGDRSLIIMIASNKGLCGGFNVNLARAVLRFLQSDAMQGKQVDYVTIGKNAERFARKTRGSVVGTFTDLTEKVGIGDMRGLRKLVLDAYESGEYANVYIAYTNFVSAIKYESVIREILPMNILIEKNILAELGKDKEGSEKKLENMDTYMFEPGEDEVLEAVLPRLFEINLYQALLESFASEQSARMVAMKNASDNAKSLVEDLTLHYNNIRQSSVTREISEIAAGADALQVE
jgi:F-type H+-transporting ATPase subunit gamma